MTGDSITNIVDKHLKKWIDKGLNALPARIDPQMSNPNEVVDAAGWQKWYPVASRITDSEIKDLEKYLDFNLPADYITFLKHKHFYDLYISDAHFCGYSIKDWRRAFLDLIFDGYPREFLIDKGYIPFATWHDWGLLCFDTNNGKTENEYTIILWDHERWDEYEYFSENFKSLLIKLDCESDANGI